MSAADSDSDHSDDVQLNSSFTGDLDYDGSDDGNGRFLGDSDSEHSGDVGTSSGAESDSDNMDQQPESTHFFEGVEKLLEVWFTRSDGKTRGCDLRKIGRPEIEHLLRIVKCEIISSMSNDHLDSYVLSESSLFVSKRRLILKTCGTTTPLRCLKQLIEFAKMYAGFDEIEDLYYSRKNYKRPEAQHFPHRNFDQEVSLLQEVFKDGGAYRLGSVGRDHWYLFTLNPFESGKPRHTGINNAEPDQTLEVLMSELDPEIMRIFTQEVCKSGEEATVKSGIDKIIPNARISEHLFEPCGYSMNGVFENSETQDPNGSYMTIHITPEPKFSYVSFETNVPHCSYQEVIGRVLDTFQPGKFVVTLFANKASMAYNSHADIDRLVAIKEWDRIESKFCTFKNYDMTYALYTKFPS